jgi:hypothetical protein
MKRAPIKALTLMAVLAVPASPDIRAQSQPPTWQSAPRHGRTTASYNLLIASGFLCDPTTTDDCPAVAQSGDGETIEISGVGSLDIGNKSLSAAGTFTQKTPTGVIVTSGVWIATALVSFHSYGIDPGAMLREYPQLAMSGMFPMGGPMTKGLPLAASLGGPVAAGGLAAIRIRLLPDAGSPEDALLRVNCARGKVPEERQTDGVKVAIAGGPSFEEQVSGRTLFLMRRPMPNPAWKDLPR